MAIWKQQNRLLVFIRNFIQFCRYSMGRQVWLEQWSKYPEGLDGRMHPQGSSVCVMCGCVGVDMWCVRCFVMLTSNLMVEVWVAMVTVTIHTSAKNWKWKSGSCRNRSKIWQLKSGLMTSDHLLSSLHSTFGAFLDWSLWTQKLEKYRQHLSGSVVLVN